MPSPLFHLRLVREHLAALPAIKDFANKKAIIDGWLQAAKRGEFEKESDVSLHGEFLARVFGDVLGYTMTSSAQDGVVHLRAECHVDKTAESADAALGFFAGDDAHVLALIALKAARHDLATARGRHPTPVQQAWESSSRAPTSKWIIVSNTIETRLYSTARGSDAYEAFQLEDLATDDGLQRFCGLLGRHTLLADSPAQDSPLDALLKASAIRQQTVARALYATFKGLRHDLFEELRLRHSNRPVLDLLQAAQTILDRVLFCAFAEDRGLLPQNRNALATALDFKSPHDPKGSTWTSLCALFAGVDAGNDVLGLPPLHGGLFRPNEDLDSLDLTDAMCERFGAIVGYDFAEDVSIEVLGHLFEQSVTDLEQLRADVQDSQFTDTQRKPSKRRAEGVFYTPSFLTHYVVDQSLGAVLADREQAIRAAVYTHGARESREREVQVWERYRDELRTIRVVDPACGSGAFLLAAYDRLVHEYERVNQNIDPWSGRQRSAFDLASHVLNENLFGVDLNGESVEITKLSMWLRTARTTGKLAYLDHNIRRGNSVVDDARVDPLAFDWARGRNAGTRFDDAPANDDEARVAKDVDARWLEGFDVVVGNPPYVRQELLTQYKDHWRARFACYDGVADVYVYFIERGLGVLKPGGRLGYVVSNKWLRAGYAESLRGYLAGKTTIERLVDFGHAPIFADADAFPCIITLQKPLAGAPRDPAHQVQVTKFPRQALRAIDVPVYVATHSQTLLQSKLSKTAWAMESGSVDALYDKIRARGVPLKEYAGCKPLYGVKTGLNEAFAVDTATRDRLVAEDPRSAEVLNKVLRGQDIERWAPVWAGQWMIFARQGIDIDAYPAIKRHLECFHERLQPRPKDMDKREWAGRKPGSYKWYELQDPVDYWQKFEAPKLVVQRIAFHSRIAVDDGSYFVNDSALIVPTSDRWLHTCLHSPAAWSLLFRTLPHKKDEAVSMDIVFVESLPIAPPTPEQRDAAEPLVARLVAATRAQHTQRAAVLDVLRMQYGVDAPGNKLSDMESTTSDDFVTEAIKRRPKALGVMKATGHAALRSLYTEDVGEMKRRRDAMRVDERALAKIVHQAYGLTPDDEQLLWESAPPRMPDAR